jgi:hypothetical protein
VAQRESDLTFQRAYGLQFINRLCDGREFADVESRRDLPSSWPGKASFAVLPFRGDDAEYRDRSR